MASLIMALSYTDEDGRRESQEHALRYLKKETISSQLNQSLAAPQSGLHHILPNTSYSAPKTLNTSALCLDVPSSDPAPMTLPARTKKRDSNGEMKQMVAKLNARADLVMLKEKATTPEGWRYGQDLPSPGHRDDGWDWETLRRYQSLMSYSATSPRTPGSRFSTEGGSKVVEEKDRQEDNSGKRKRQGSLLEWRNKEMFEEPVRI
jgi:hypothetical protein